MGLPLSFRTNKERNGISGGEKKNAKRKPVDNYNTLKDGNLDSDDVSEGMISFHTANDKMTNPLSCNLMVGKSESSYYDIAVSVNGIQLLSDTLVDSTTLTDSACADVEKYVNEPGTTGAEHGDYPFKNVLSEDDTITKASAIDIIELRPARLHLATNSVEHIKEEQNGGSTNDAKKNTLHDGGCGMTNGLDVDANSQSTNIHDCGKTDIESCSDFEGWKMYWDTFYMRNYFYNVETQESTWIAPPGMEHIAVEDANESKDMTLEGAEKELCAAPFQYIGGIDSCCMPCDIDGFKERRDKVESIEMPPKDGKANFGLADYVKDSGNLKRKKKAKRTWPHRKSSIDHIELRYQHILEELPPTIHKYWFQRYLLFSKFDEGIKIDEEGWFSVTPECIAKHHSSRCGSGMLVDLFTGVGGNAIQFAGRCDHVVAIDIDATRIDYAQNNAAVYGVADRIDFIRGDAYLLASKLKADTVFLSPPWGGPDYAKSDTYDIKTMLKPHDGQYLFNVARRIASRVVMFLPRNVDIDQLVELSLSVDPPWLLEVEKNFLNGRLKAITAYFSESSP